MRLKCNVLCEGMHPSERLISINTNGGKCQVIVDERSIENDTIEVGWPVGYRDGFILVELPRETVSGPAGCGVWRVYVDQYELLENDD